MQDREGQETYSASELRTVQTLLWEHLSSQLKTAERDEFKRALGRSLIEGNECLFAEAEALADILGTVQLSTATALQRQKLCRNPNRSMVENEIRMLINHLLEVAGTAPFTGSAVYGRDPEAVIPKSTKKDRAVVDYVSTVSAAIAAPAELLQKPPTAPGLRPGTAVTSRPPSSSSMTMPHTSSRQGTASSRPSTASSGGSGSGSTRSDPRSIVQMISGQLNVWDIDSVKEFLFKELLEEQAALMEDIEYLQSLLEQETDFQARADQPAPSVQDLKEYSGKLREAVAAEEQRVAHEMRVSRMFSVADEEPGRARRLRGIVNASRGSEEGQSSSPCSNGIQTLNVSTSMVTHQSSALVASGVSRSPLPSALVASGVSRSSLPSGSSDVQNAPTSPSRLIRSTSSSSRGLLDPPEGQGKPRPTSPTRALAPSSSSTLEPYSIKPSSLGSVGLLASIPVSGRRPLAPLTSSPVATSTSTSMARVSSVESSVNLARAEPLRKSPGPAASMSNGKSSKPSNLITIEGTQPRPQPEAVIGGFRGHAGSRTGTSGSPINLVEALDAECDAVLGGGVAAILAKHNYRPSSAQTGPILRE